MQRITLTTRASKDYELVDTGDEQKLERYGNVLLARPDPQALWPKLLSEAKWAKANGRYERGSSTNSGQAGKWIERGLPKSWDIEFGGLTFAIKPTSFKHTGLFPEQEPNWEWIAKILEAKNPEGGFRARRRENLSDFSVEKSRTPRGVALPKVLNLFGYTGGATLAAAKAGAEVVHVDASKTAVAWAKENAKLSGLGEAPIRWIVEDALTFVEREIKRGNTYDGIIMDPPAFGHGPKDELWKIEEDFIKLVGLCAQLLSPDAKFFLINGYAAGYSSLAFAYNLEPVMKKFGPSTGLGASGLIEHGDLTIEESGSAVARGTNRLLPAGIFARWSRS